WTGRPASWPRSSRVTTSSRRTSASAATTCGPRTSRCPARAGWRRWRGTGPASPSHTPHRARISPVTTTASIATFGHMSEAATLDSLPLLASGKVREMYDMGDRILMVASDRISTYDVVHPTPIPGKGQVLTGISVFWFGKTEHICRNHLVSFTDVP